MALQDKLIDALGRFATTFNSYRYIMAIKSAFITLMPVIIVGAFFGADLQYGAGSEEWARQLFLALLQPGLGIGQPLLRLLQLFLQQGDLQLALLRLLVGGGQLLPQGLELLLLGLRLGLGRGGLLHLGRLGRLGFRQLPPDSLQLLPVLLVRRLNIRRLSRKSMI